MIDTAPEEQFRAMCAEFDIKVIGGADNVPVYFNANAAQLVSGLYQIPSTLQ